MVSSTWVYPGRCDESVHHVAPTETFDSLTIGHGGLAVETDHGDIHGAIPWALSYRHGGALPMS